MEVEKTKTRTKTQWYLAYIFQSSAEQNLYLRRISLKYWITKRNSELIEDCIKSEV
jgi:hypothetical protein